MISKLYSGSVKDLLGPVRVASNRSTSGDIDAVVFDYTDAFSVFDWGKMPNGLPDKGKALAVMGAYFFELLENPERWKAFSRSSGALALRKGNRFGSLFNEIGEDLQQKGLKTHYLGVIESKWEGESGEFFDRSRVGTLQSMKAPFRGLLAQRVEVVKPVLTSVLGRAVADYSDGRGFGDFHELNASRLIPLEVVFRFSCPPGSSLRKKVEQNPAYLETLGFPSDLYPLDAPWGFPVLELFTKLEPTDRCVGLSEALAITGLPAPVLNEVLLKTAWVAGILREEFSRLGLDLADGKLEWGMVQGESGLEVMLVDAIGLDELRVLTRKTATGQGGLQLSKEFLRNFYRNTDWFEEVEAAKVLAEQSGSSQWKRFVKKQPPELPADQIQLSSQLYQVLANELTASVCGPKRWFPEAWTLNQLLDGLSSRADQASELPKVEAQVAAKGETEGEKGEEAGWNIKDPWNLLSEGPSGASV